MSHLAPYRPYLDNWKRDAGKKPTAREFETVHKEKLARMGSKAALAVAMALREDGVTQHQMEIALGSPHRNKLMRVVDDGKATLVPHVYGNHMAYRLKVD
jgi:hypothetical protein